MFASVERSYKDLQELVKPISFAPSVMCDLKTSSTWYTPGGNSTIARLYADAGANYIFREDTHSGSLPYPFEVIFEKGQQTDFWLIRYNQPIDKTYKELEKNLPLMQVSVLSRNGTSTDVIPTGFLFTKKRLSIRTGY